MGLDRLDNRAAMLAELASRAPQWDEENTVLMRMVAAKLMRTSGLDRDVALTQSGFDLNSLVKRAITFGYALREYDRQNGIARTIEKGKVN
jgi:hypothetical protein